MIAAALAATALAGAPATTQPDAPLPAIAITTRRQIRDDPKVRARVRIAGAYDGWAGIELRGQSSQTFPKRSYAVELRTRTGANRNAPLLGMPSDDDWALYAAYNDKTLIRNVVAYEVARATGRWAPRTRFVELRLNGRYQGVYVLMETPKLHDARAHGAWMVELTFPYQARRKGARFTTPITGRPIVYEDPERDDLTARRARTIRSTVRAAERGLYRGGWRSRLDEAAAVDFVLVQELFRNVDAFHASTYLTKPRTGRLQLGPVWDFDLSSGNSTYGTSRFVRRWWTRERDWAERLHADRRFRAALARRWRELRRDGIRAVALNAVDRAAAQVRPAAGRNFRRWPILGRRVWQNPAARGSHAAEVRYLRRWLIRRIGWMDRATRTATTR